MVALVVLSVLATLVVVVAVVAHRQDVRRKRHGRPAAASTFEDTQGHILGKGGNTASGTGTGIGPFGGPSL